MPNHIIMRKYFLILYLVAICTGASAQKVTLNERDEKGIRNIETGMRAFYVDHHMNACQLGYTENKGEEYFVFTISFSDQASRWKALSGQELMMKDAKGNITTIKSMGISSSTIANNTQGNGASYMCSVRYFLTKEQAQVFRDGLTKLRVNITYDKTGAESLFDVDIPADLTKYLTKAVANIDKTIPTPVWTDKSVF